MAPARGDVTVSVALSNLSVSLGNPAFVGGQLFPEFPVKRETDTYFKWVNREYLRHMSTKRARGSKSREVDFKPTTDTYKCEEYALSKFLDNRTLDDAESPVRLIPNTISFLKLWTDLDYEKDVVNATTKGGLSNSTPSVKWDATSGTITIENNLDTAKTSIRQNGGGIANTVLFNDTIKNAVKKDDTLRNLIRYTITGSGGQALLVNGELPPVLFGLRVVVSGSVEDTSKEGQSASISEVWPNSAIVAYVDPNPGMETKTFGITFAKKVPGTGVTSAVKTWLEPGRDGKMYEVAMIKVPKVVASQCGYNLHSVLT